MLDYDEKRDFIRMQAGCRMTYRPAGAENFSEGTCVNISGSGILFRTDEPLEAGKAMEVRLEPENRLTPPLTAYVEIVRCDPAEDGRYDIAGAIKGIKSE